MIFLSTGGESNKTAYESAEYYRQHGIKNIELSGGVYEENVGNKLASLKNAMNFRVHNYFPPPKKPFVFNLASDDEIIIEQSMLLAKNAIDLAVELGTRVYSFHAGFLIQPSVKELGKSIKKRELLDRHLGLENFLMQVNILAEYAEKRDCELLIENNVLSESNYKRFSCNPLLMTEPNEAEQIMLNTPSNVNLLIDLAHLKVSANSLSYDPVEMLSRCDTWIKAYHLSENDGLSDLNEPFEKDSWFWRHLKQNLDYYSIEVYNTPIEELVLQIELAEKMLGVNA